MAPLPSSYPVTNAQRDSLAFKPAPAVAILLLILMGFLAGGAAMRESATFDEFAHIGAGVSYLQKLDLRYNEEHPPLAKILAAIPLVLRGARADYNHITWTIGTKFFPHAFMAEWIFGEWLVARWNDPESTLAWARLPMLLLTLVLGWVVFACGRRIGGDWGGLLSVSVYATAPAFIAFGPLVLTDTAIALFCLLTLGQFAQLWQEPSRKNMVLFGLCLAGALLTKFSSGLLFFSFGAFALSTRFRTLPGLPSDKAEFRAWRRLRWRWTLKGTLLAAIIVYCFYLFFSLGQSTDALYLLGNSDAWVPVRRILMPPWLYFRGMLFFVFTSVRPTFILGKGYAHGVWFYFPVLTVLKSPLGHLGLWPLLIVLALRRTRRTQPVPAVPPEESLRWRVIWISLLVFTAACMLSGMTISIRHFSVPLILLIVMLALLPRMIRDLTRETRSVGRATAAVAALLAASSMVSVVRAYPYYIPFFNSLTWSRPIYWWASDSNVDWNQALPEVREFADQHGLKSLAVGYYGNNDPTITVPQARFWDCQQPASEDAGQWVVVSSNVILDAQNCAWLMQYPHQMLAGGSMWAVQLPAVIPAAGEPGGPPPASERKFFLGMPMDSRPPTLELFRHPESLPQYCADMEAQMTEYIRQYRNN